MAKTRLTADEKRAAELCGRITEKLRWSDSAQIFVTWKRSQMWGWTPTVVYPDGSKVLTVTGCGFDKRSSALAQVLAPLCPQVMRADSAGTERVIEAMKENGWKLEHTVDGPGFDVFTLYRKTECPES